MTIVVKPLAVVPETEQQLHLVEAREDGPIRCNRCKCYMCPGFGFIDGGRRFQCHMCCCITDVSAFSITVAKLCDTFPMYSF